MAFPMTVDGSIALRAATDPSAMVDVLEDALQRQGRAASVRRDGNSLYVLVRPLVWSLSWKVLPWTLSRGTVEVGTGDSPAVNYSFSFKRGLIVISLLSVVLLFALYLMSLFWELPFAAVILLPVVGWFLNFAYFYFNTTPSVRLLLEGAVDSRAGMGPA